MTYGTVLVTSLAMLAAQSVPNGTVAAVAPAGTEYAARLTARGMGLSPDGNLLAFVARDNAGVGVFTLDRRYASVTRVTTSSGPEWTPSFSGDGRSLYYSALGAGGGAVQLLISKLDGADPVPVVLPGAVVLLDSAGPVGSPDGKWLAFAGLPDEIHDTGRAGEQAAVDAPWRIYLLRLGRAAMLAHSAACAAEARPAFSGDGTLLSFRGERYMPMPCAYYSQLLFCHADLGFPIVCGWLADFSGLLDPEMDPEEPVLAPMSGPAHAAKADCLVGVVSEPSLMLKAADDTGGRVSRTWSLTAPVEGLCVTPDGSRILGLLDPGDGWAWELWSFRISDGEKHRVASNQLFTDPLAWRPDKETVLPLW